MAQRPALPRGSTSTTAWATPLACRPCSRAALRHTTIRTITLFGTVSNSATSRTSKNGRKYTAFGVAIIPDRNLQAFHYNIVAFGKQGHFAKPLQKGTRIKLVVQAQSQPDYIATLPLLTATFGVCLVARRSQKDSNTASTGSPAIPFRTAHARLNRN